MGRAPRPVRIWLFRGAGHPGLRLVPTPGIAGLDRDRDDEIRHAAVFLAALIVQLAAGASGRPSGLSHAIGCADPGPVIRSHGSWRLRVQRARPATRKDQRGNGCIRDDNAGTVLTAGLNHWLRRAGGG
jgi:hypothetical protein